MKEGEGIEGQKSKKQAEAGHDLRDTGTSCKARIIQGNSPQGNDKQKVNWEKVMQKSSPSGRCHFPGPVGHVECQGNVYVFLGEQYHSIFRPQFQHLFTVNYLRTLQV